MRAVREPQNLKFQGRLKKIEANNQINYPPKSENDPLI
jgi:hypothetical protein